ncbi:hypothetical protein CBS115989_7136 [Aspergillus niger]|nr:uncharacterized protein BO96DRAFT_501534 [Aspergillus niger CBS 101883]KAI2816072.1 hypothetical protein CBS115989_7136 [Aspergillus niger]RDH19553.1 hypothetical protein M747DRAFT_296391 [Aspergillus niger ATCC 13496]KAI2857721.1 hypothetical protein CBS11232_3093 [Aspergillus niger]KAI2877933.1 hypothetical protein CBS115988_3591 [Aspergillus niger]KAI2910423.1 hypothetical protein CBS147371_8917 [Aspergillus niger]|eukprot:XP_001390065.2 hypothetical protein ANI_1_1066034 [Aspergillus niger CBS 513.88]
MDTIKQTMATTPNHTEEEQRKLYDSLPAEQRNKQSFTEWVKEAYNEQYEKWMPWLEDQYLKWFGKGDNKASYVTKDNLSKTKVTGVKQADQIQDDVNNLVGNQLGENGLLAPVGNMVSKEGLNRAERGGKDENGSYGGPLGGATDPIVHNSKKAGQGLATGIQSAGSSVASGARSWGSTIPGFGSK